MTRIPPRKRKTAANSLRNISRRLGIPYRHTKTTDDGTRAEEALLEFRDRGGIRLEDLKSDLAKQTKP